MLKILVLQGPNLNYLGKREPEYYGTRSAAELDAEIREHANRNKYEVSIFYTNSEGAAVDRLYQAVDEGVHGLLMNPAAFALAGYSIYYCIRAIKIPYVEVHIRNQYTMDVVSKLGSVAEGVIQGFGFDSYLLGLDALTRLLQRRQERDQLVEQR